MYQVKEYLQSKLRVTPKVEFADFTSLKKIVFNPLNEMYNVVELQESATACPIGQGKTKSQAMAAAYRNHRFCNDAVKGGIEDIIILFDYEE